MIMPRKPASWIQSEKFDITLFAASFLVGPFCYFVFVLFTKGRWVASDPQASVLFFVLFTAIFDAPHIFQTFFRTHFDGIEFPRHPIKHSASLALALLIVFTCTFVNMSGPFIEVLGIYGGWHISRQNIGFTKLYSRLAKEESRVTEYRVATLYWCYAFFLINERNSMNDLSEFLLPLSGKITTIILNGIWIVVFLGFLNSLRKILKFDFAGWRTNVTPSSSLLIFYAAIIYFVSLSLVNVPMLVMIALATIAHNIQYQTWMWLYQTRTTRKPKIAWMWLGGTLIAGCLLCLPLSGTSGLGLLEQDWLSTGYNGLVLWHYFIDGEIWIFRRMPELAVMTGGHDGNRSPANLA
jgi:hypothetical protein